MCAGSSMAEQLTIQLKDGGSNPTSALHSWWIDRIEHREAKAFVEQWHYSERIPTGKNVSFGLRHNGELYAVIVWGIGVNPYQAAFLKVDGVVEIKRMCRIEPPRDYPLSRLISITAKKMKHIMDFGAIVAFADPEQGHEGTVYKASGFTHEGVTNPEWHLIDKAGVVRHRRYAYRHARRNDCTVAESREALGVERIKTEPKHRWVRRFKKKHSHCHSTEQSD